MSIDALYNHVSTPTSPIGKLYAQMTPAARQQARIDNGTNPGSGEGKGGGGSGTLAHAQTVATESAAHPINLGGQTLEQYFGNQALLNQDTTGNWANPIITTIIAGALTAGAGAALGGTLAGTAGTAGGAATAGAGGAALGTGGALTGLGSAVVGAGAGAVGGTASAALSGGNIGKGALLGGVMGGIGGGLKPFVQGATGLTGTTGNIVNSGITGAGTGAVRGAITGQGALQGAISGAQSGATSAAGSAVTGSIFNSGNTVSSQLTQQTNPSTPNVSVDPSYFNTSGIQPIPMDTGYGAYNPAGDPNAASFNNYGNNPGTDTSLAALMGGLNPNYQVSNSYLNSGVGSGGGNGATAGAAGSATSSLLSRLLGGGSSGNGSPGNSGLLGNLAGLFGGSNSGLLASLLGMGASGIGGSLQSQAAKSAAGNFAGQTAFNPYSVNSNGGQASFNGTTANSSLSPGNAQLQGNLQGLGNSSIAGLQAGPQAASQGYFNNLQAQDQDANNKFYQSNLDNQMANGVLSSTAGQYQSQAALGAINNKTAQNQVMANNFGQNQQQQQLQQLTASLNGNQGFNSQGLAQTALGGQLGSAASGANVSAYSPSLAANSNNNIGNLLATMGNTQNAGNSNSNALLQYLLQNQQAKP